MGEVIAITCPHCGGRVERVGNEYFAKCPYCGVEIAFNEIKEEAQVGAYRERIDVLEQNENTDREKRLTMQRWIRIRNIVFAVLNLTNFLGFVLVGCETMGGIDKWVNIGALLMFVTCAGFLPAVPLLAFNYPGYNALYKKEEKFGQVRMLFVLGGVGIGLFLLSAIAAYFTLRLMFG